MSVKRSMLVKTPASPTAGDSAGTDVVATAWGSGGAMRGPPEDSVAGRGRAQQETLLMLVKAVAASTTAATGFLQ